MSNNMSLAEYHAMMGTNLKPKSRERNRRTIIDGIKFDSKEEGLRYLDLKKMQTANLIKDLKLKVKFELAPAVKILGRMRPPLRYFADFTYTEVASGKFVVEDVKGKKSATDTYRIKRHLMMSEHGIAVLEYRRSRKVPK